MGAKEACARLRGPPRVAAGARAQRAGPGSCSVLSSCLLFVRQGPVAFAQVVFARGICAEARARGRWLRFENLLRAIQTRANGASVVF
eukprot:7544598-Lingulodinium_polyedra.AAC.1